MVSSSSKCCPNNGCGNGGCPRNYNLGVCPCGVCPSEKTEFQLTIEQARCNIDEYNLKKRLLTDRFRRRKRSKCDSFQPLSKHAYEAKIAKIDSAIASNKKVINQTKLNKFSKNRIHDPSGNCVGCPKTGCGNKGANCCC